MKYVVLGSASDICKAFKEGCEHTDSQQGPHHPNGLSHIGGIREITKTDCCDCDESEIDTLEKGHMVSILAVQEKTSSHCQPKQKKPEAHYTKAHISVSGSFGPNFSTNKLDPKHDVIIKHAQPIIVQRHDDQHDQDCEQLPVLGSRRERSVADGRD